MPPRYPIDELVALHARTQVADEVAAGEASEAYGEAFGWIDHRALESEVVQAFAWQLDEGDVLAFREDDDDRVTPIRNGVEYRVPLTRTGSDRYVMIHSLAEILKDRYTVLLEAGSRQGDTHAVLVLPHAQVAELQQRHARWMQANLATLTPGRDEFNGLQVPWYGHEDAAPGFAHVHAAKQARIEQQKADLRRIFEVPKGKDLRDGIAAAGARVEQRLQQQQAAWVYAMLASALGVITFTGWTQVRGPIAWTWVGLLAAAGAYHAWVASRMRRGWRPNVAMRWLAVIVLLVLVFSVPGLSR